MSLDTSPHLFYARVDPRRRTHAVGIYTHVLDQHGIVYNQPIVLNERPAGVAIEGAVRHSDTREDVGLLALAVDTHGYTNVGMAVSKLLGFDLCPRLRNLSQRKLYLPRGIEMAKDLAPIVDHGISLKPIHDGWDGLLRLVASIKSGRVSAVVALQRFGSAAQGDPIYRAAEQLGKLLRTLFLCDYFSNVEFRRELHALLSRGESVHELQRTIYTGKVAPERGRRRVEMIAISGSLTLLTNLVIAWNTQRMQATVDAWRGKGQQVDDDWLRRSDRIPDEPFLVQAIQRVPIKALPGTILVTRAFPCTDLQPCLSALSEASRTAFAGKAGARFCDDLDMGGRPGRGLLFS